MKQIQPNDEIIEIYIILSKIYLNKNKIQLDTNNIIKYLKMCLKNCNEIQREEIQTIIDNYTNTIKIGIDLGTSNCYCGVINNNKDIKIITDNDGGYNISSGVYYNPNSANIRVGNSTSNLTEDVVNGSKRLIGRKFNDKLIQNDMKFLQYKIVNGENDDPIIELVYNRNTIHLSVVDITTELLNHIKNSLDSSSYVDKNENIEAVIAVPIYFNRNQIEIIIQSCEKAGLKVKTISEPISVISGYVYYSFGERFSDIKTFLLYDFGGGCFNVSIFRVNYDKRIITLLSTGGDSHLGGIDINNRLVDYYSKKYKDKTGKDLKAKQLSQLKRECEKAKITLSSKIDCDIDFVLLKDNFVDLHLSRKDFNKMNEDFFDETMNIVDKVLNNANLNTNDIDFVMSIGGTSRIAKIQEILKMKFQHCDLNRVKINPDEVVAYGSCAFSILKEMEFRIEDKLIQLPYETNQNQYIYPLNYFTSIPKAKFDYPNNENEKEECLTSLLRKSNNKKVYF